MPRLQNQHGSRKVGGSFSRACAQCQCAFVPVILKGGGEFVDVNVIPHGTTTLIRLRGSLRLGGGVEELTKTIDLLFQQGQKKFVLNMAEVPMMDSSAIGLLVRSHTHSVKQGGGITLVQPSKFVIQTLQLVGVLRLFQVAESETQALAGAAPAAGAAPDRTAAEP